MAAIIEPEGPPGPDDPPAPLLQRLAWFVGLCVAGSASVAVVAYVLRSLPFMG